MQHKLREIIKVILFIRDISKRKIASKAGLSYPTVHNYLSRNSEMRIENLEKIFEALGFSFMEALNLAEQNLKMTVFQAWIILEPKEEEGCYRIYGVAESSDDEKRLMVMTQVRD